MAGGEKIVGSSFWFLLNSNGDLLPRLATTKLKYADLESFIDRVFLSTSNQEFHYTNPHARVQQNLHGLIVAFSMNNKQYNNSTASNRIAALWEWKIGVVICHSFNSTAIYPLCFNNTKQLAFDTQKPCLFPIPGSFTLKFLSHAIADCDGFVQQLRPLVLSFVKKDKRYIKKLLKNKLSPLSIAMNLAIAESLVEAPVLFKTPPLSSFDFKDHHRKHPVVARKGTTVLSYTGPTSMLNPNHRIKGFWLPLDVYPLPNSHQQKKQRYRILADIKSYKFTRRSGWIDLVTAEQGVTKKVPVISTDFFDLADFPNGLLITFLIDQSLAAIELTSQSVLTADSSLFDLDGIPISHWFTDVNIYSLPAYLPNLMTDCFGAKGFGHRNISKCGGGNHYQGIKDTHATVSSPFVPKYAVNTAHRTYASMGDSTYVPVAVKIMNMCSKQAGDVMERMDPVLDLFISHVWSILEQQSNVSLDPDLMKLSFRRHCKASILTCGNDIDKSNGFFNELHRDGDNLCTEFQVASKIVLDQWESEFGMIKEISYLKDLAILNNGIATPSVIGYDIIPGSKKPMHGEELWAEFLFYPLSISIRIRPKFFHYFQACSASHCTPIPVTVRSSHQSWILNTMRINADIFNIVGWGVGGTKKTTINHKAKAS